MHRSHDQDSEEIEPFSPHQIPAEDDFLVDLIRNQITASIDASICRSKPYLTSR